MTQIKCKHTELVDPSTLKDHPRNANKHPQIQVDALAANIREFGWRHPIVVSKLSGNIVMGHCRRDAALKLNCQAPVDYQEFQSEDEEIAVLTSDNVIPELAEIDAALLEANKDLIQAAGIDLTVIGFETEVESDDQRHDSTLPEEYKIIIICRSEEHQAQLLERFMSEGLECRALML